MHITMNVVENLLTQILAVREQISGVLSVRHVLLCGNQVGHTDIAAPYLGRAGRGDLAQVWEAAREREASPAGEKPVYQPQDGVGLPGGVLAHSYGGELMDEGASSRQAFLTFRV